MNTDEFIEWLKEHSIGTYEMPRDREKILATGHINFSNNGLNDISKQICFLKHLNRLNLGNNNLRELPKEIINLVNLKELILENNPLTLSPSQVIWIEKLKNNGCEVILPKEKPDSRFTRMFLVDEPREPDFTSDSRTIKISKEHYQNILTIAEKMIRDNISKVDIRPEVTLSNDEGQTEETIHYNRSTDGCTVILHKRFNTNDMYISIEMSDGEFVRASQGVDFEELEEFFKN